MKEKRKITEGLERATSRMSMVTTSFVLLLFIQAVTFISRYLFINEFSYSDVTRFFISIADFTNTNWMPLSVVLILMFVGSVYFSMRQKRQNIPANAILLLINILLCGRLYETESVMEKITVLRENAIPVMVFVGFIIMILFLISIMIKAKGAQSELPVGNGFYGTNGIYNGNGNIPVSLDSESEMQSGTENPRTTSINEDWIARHPIAYMWRLYKIYRTKAQKEKYEKMSEYKKIKHEKTIAARDKRLSAKMAWYERRTRAYNAKLCETDAPAPWEGKAAIYGTMAITAILIAAIVFGPLPSFWEMVNRAISFFSQGIDANEQMSGVLLRYLQGAGALFLLVIAFVFLEFLLYFTIRIVIYFIRSREEDRKYVQKISRLMKIFFIGIIENVFFLLITIPSLISDLEHILIPEDFDLRIEEKFGDYDKECRKRKSAVQSYDLPQTQDDDI